MKRKIEIVETVVCLKCTGVAYNSSTVVDEFMCKSCGFTIYERHHALKIADEVMK